MLPTCVPLSTIVVRNLNKFSLYVSYLLNLTVSVSRSGSVTSIANITNFTDIVSPVRPWHHLIFFLSKPQSSAFKQYHHIELVSCHPLFFLTADPLSLSQWLSPAALSLKSPLPSFSELHHLFLSAYRSFGFPMSWFNITILYHSLYWLISCLFTDGLLLFNIFHKKNYHSDKKEKKQSDKTGNYLLYCNTSKILNLIVIVY